MKRLLQINPVVRTNTSTGRIMREIGSLAIANGWESYMAYSHGRDPHPAPSDSHLVPVGNRADVAIHGLATRLADRHGLASVAATRSFITDIRHINPDVIHIHNIHGYFLNYKTLFDYLATCGKPVIWTVHDCWLYTGHCYYYSFAGCNKWQTGCGQCPQKKSFPASYVLDRSAKNWADKRAAFTSIPTDKLTIVPVSQWICGELQKSFLKDYPMEVIHNGIDLSTFQPHNDTEIRKKYALSNRHTYIGIASIWSREKGLDDLIALSTMLTDDETLVLVGVDDKTAQRLPNNIVAIRRTDNIQQLAALYSTADALLNPTWQDNYPTVNLEAIACGTPVITYRTGGSIEAITTETGAVVDQGDITGLLHAARTMGGNDRSVTRAQCREYAEQHFNKTDRYADYFRLYQRMTAG